MERFKILKIKEHKATKDNDYYFNLLLKDNLEHINFWLDCSIEEEEGEKYINWEFNQYIFSLYNSIDIKAKEYQENSDNVEDIIYFIDFEKDNILKQLKERSDKNENI